MPQIDISKIKVGDKITAEITVGAKQFDRFIDASSAANVKLNTSWIAAKDIISHTSKPPELKVGSRIKHMSAAYTSIVKVIVDNQWVVYSIEGTTGMPHIRPLSSCLKDIEEGFASIID